MCVFDADSATTEEGICRQTFFRGSVPYACAFPARAEDYGRAITRETRRLYAGRFVRGSTRNSGGDSIRELIPSQDAGDSSFRICWPSVLP